MLTNDQIYALAVQAGARVFKKDRVVVCDNGISGSGTDFVEKFAKLCYAEGYQVGIQQGVQLDNQEN